MARLWGALAREPIPGLDRKRTAGTLTVTLPGDRRLTGPHAAAEPFAPAPDGLTLHLDGHPYDDPARLVRDLPLPGAKDRLAAELDNSVANLALARAAQPPPDGGPPMLERSLADLEQCVVDGHPLHPCCRTRMGMSTEEVLAYAPELRPVVDVELVRVPENRWLTTGTGLPPVLPVHPWQRDHVLDRYPWLQPTGDRVKARPLMSLRTLAPFTRPAEHWKTAVDVQMTSAVRTVSPAAVRNGPALSARVAGLAQDITVLRELAGGAALVDGEPCRSLAVIVRQAPRISAVPLAVLAAPSRRDGRPVIREAVGSRDPVAFFADLCRVMLPPLLALLDAGVGLEAHGQNTLVEIRENRPVRLLYRDMGGVRTRFEAEGDLHTDDPVVLRTKLLAAAVCGALAEQVAVLSREYGVEPEKLWAQAAGMGMEDEVLPLKATTAMRLAADPLEDIWAWVPNPMAGVR